MAVLCLAWLAGSAFAQQTTAAPEPDQAQAKPDPAAAEPNKTAPKPDPAAGNADQDAPNKKSLERKAKPGKTKGKGKAGCGSSKKRGAKTDLTPNPNAKWACDQKTVVLDPVWQGKKLNFTFKIRNEGTADLRMKARGG